MILLEALAKNVFWFQWHFCAPVTLFPVNMGQPRAWLSLTTCLTWSPSGFFPNHDNSQHECSHPGSLADSNCLLFEGTFFGPFSTKEGTFDFWVKVWKRALFNWALPVFHDTKEIPFKLIKYSWESTSFETGVTFRNPLFVRPWEGFHYHLCVDTDGFYGTEAPGESGFTVYGTGVSASEFDPLRFGPRGQGALHVLFIRVLFG